MSNRDKMPRGDQGVLVHFTTTNPEALQKWLQQATEQFDPQGICVGYRIDDGVSRRAALVDFASAMEIKLRKNDHKSSWRDLPIVALFRQLLLEIEELKVAMDYLPVEEARDECVDVANFGLILWDRLSMMEEGRTVGAQRSD